MLAKWLIYSLIISVYSLAQFGLSESSRRVTLDIFHPDPSSIETLTRRPYGILTVIYRPKDGYNISSIVDRDTILWTSSNTHSCDYITVLTRGYYTTHANVYLRDNEGQIYPLYFEQVDYEKNEEQSSPFWAPITESTFYSSFHRRVKTEVQKDRITLDITEDQDPVFFYVNKSPKFPFAVYAANSACRIMRIMDGQTTVWSTRGEDHGCLYASFYPRETPMVAYLIIETSDGVEELYYHRVGNEWISALKNEYRLGLYTNGFNESTFDNTIILDISNVDGEAFHQCSYSLSAFSKQLLTPLPGYRLTSVMDGSAIIWTAEEEGEHCKCVSVCGEDKRPMTSYLLVKSPQNGRRVLYYAKDDGKWKRIDSNTYYRIFTHRDPSIYTHEVDHPNIVMSSFRNKQGLRIASYASTVDSAKGDIILIHGLRSHFMATFLTASVDWSFIRLDFPSFPHIKPFGESMPSMELTPVDMYRHLFEDPYMNDAHNGMSGGNRVSILDASSIFPAYEYEGSFVECLNRLGYNAYGFDLQSHGLSEGTDSVHTLDFVSTQNYVHDLMQFVSIIRRGKFNDSFQSYDEQTVFASHPSAHKLFLLGDSMGGNVVIQAIQEFYRMASNPSAHFVDGLICLSAMLNIDHYLDTWWKRISARPVLGLLSLALPEGPNPSDKATRFGESPDYFMRYTDPFFKTNRFTFRATEALFDACDDVRRGERMAYYPKGLPTLFMHSKEDPMCGISGPREVVERHLKGRKDVQLLELEGTCHYLTVSQTTFVVMGYIGKWLAERMECE